MSSRKTADASKKKTTTKTTRTRAPVKAVGQKITKTKTKTAAKKKTLTGTELLMAYLTDQGKTTLSTVEKNIDLTPYIIPSLIPDLIDYLDTYDDQLVAKTARESDPEQPESFIFNSVYQQVHQSTLKVEQDLLTNDYEVDEGLIECPKCKSKRIRTVQIQTRSADEPATLVNYCTICKNKWSFSAA